MKLAADMGRHSGRALPSLHDAPYRQIEEATGRQSTYPSPIAVQTNPATSFLRIAEQSDLMNMLGSWVLHEACSVAARWSLQLSYQLPSGGVVPHR